MKKLSNSENNVLLTETELNEKIALIVNSELSKSKKIIELFELCLEIKEIANIMNIRYNFAYNVISNYSNIHEIALDKQNSEYSKKDQIIELFKEGKKNVEIAKLLKLNYNYIFKVLKEFKETELIEETK